MSPRKTRLRLAANLYRAGFAPAGSPPRGFRSVDCCLHHFLLSQAFLAPIAWHLRRRRRRRREIPVGPSDEVVLADLALQRDSDTSRSVPTEPRTASAEPCDSGF